MTTSQDRIAGVIDRAIELVRLGWAQHAQARRADGSRTFHGDPKATAYSLDGALSHASVEAGIYGSPMIGELGLAIAAETGTHALAGWNDTRGRTQADVLSVLRAARKKRTASTT